MNLEKYPNLEAILNGTVAGSFRDWIAVRPELISLITQVGKLESENTELIEERTWLYAVNKKWQGKHKKLLARVEELETLLSKVQAWGADARSADSYEVFEAVRVSLIDLPMPEVTVVDCTCVPCVCFSAIRGGQCVGCGARTCLAHELAKGGSK